MNSQDKEQRKAWLGQKLSALPKTYCVLPFMHATADVDARLIACCRYKPSRQSQAHTVKDFDHWWQNSQQVMRDELLSGKQHTGCVNCWEDEAAGVVSYRQDCNEMFMDHVGITEPLPRPVFWLMGIGNYCNIRCIMCSPHRSTNWAVEFEHNRKEFQKINISWQGYTRGNWADPDLEPLDTVAQDAEMIHFSGGEPLMTNDYKRVLRSVQNPSRTVLHINSNLTEVDDEWMTLLTQFKTTVNVSLEGVGEFNDYIRYGSRWADVDRNINRLLDAGVDVGIAHAFGRTSLSALPALLDYCAEKNIRITLSPLRSPDHLALDTAPPNERQDFIQKIRSQELRHENIVGYFRIQGFINQLESEPYNAVQDQKFWQYINLLDKLHGMNYREISKNAKQA